MRPIRAANQLTHVWRAVCPNGNPYPVDCRSLAAALHIKVHGEPIDDKFEAQLRIRGKSRAIIYNENIREEGRKNFCISHELGHHSCHSELEEYFCTSRDLNDMAPHPQNIEQEANLFAATLLMPPDDFREQIDGQEPSLSFIASLAEERYRTSLTATCRRLIDLSPTSNFGMAFVRGRTVVRWARSQQMQYTGFGFRRGHRLPITVNHNPFGEDVESAVWLNDKNAPKWMLRQSSIYMPYYGETLVLVQAEQASDSEHWREFEESDPTPPRIPSFK